MVTIFMMSAKIATLSFLKIKVKYSKNTGYEVIIYVHDVTIKFLLRDSDYIVEVFI